MKEIEEKLAFIKFNMEMEGFEIPKELEEQGRKVLLGELDGKKVLEKYIHQAKNLGRKY